MLTTLDRNLIFKAEKPPQKLYFLGTIHSSNPTDPQFLTLNNMWREFLISTEDKIVFTEIPIGKFEETFEGSILKYGEGGAIQWLAKEGNVSVICPEPDVATQREILSKLFDPQLVVYALIIQNISAWLNAHGQTDFDGILEKSINREAKFFNPLFSIDREWFITKHKELFGEKDLKDREFMLSISDPRKDTTPVNKIIAMRTQIRNDSLFLSISEMWRSNKSIFIVYGKGHLVSLESLLGNMVAV